MHTFSPLPNAPVPRFPLKDSIRGAKPHTLRSIGQWCACAQKREKEKQERKTREGETRKENKRSRNRELRSLIGWLWLPYCLALAACYQVFFP